MEPSREDQVSHSGLTQRENPNPKPNAHGDEAAGSGWSRVELVT